RGLEELLENGRKNKVMDLRMISSKEVRKLEPYVNANAAIFCPSTGIIDTHRLMKYFETTAKDNNGMVVYGCEVKTIEKIPHGYRIGVQEADGGAFSFSTRVLINSAGLESANIAALAGINIDEAGYHIYYYKGEYFRVSGGKHKFAQRLIYPSPPQPGYAGVHTVPDLHGMMKIGPYNYFVEDIDYSVDESHKGLVYEAVKTFLPFIEFQDLEPDMSGIQPKIQKLGDPEKDFIIVHEEGRGFPGFINLIGIESPGLTSSPAIANLIENMIERII
ncbi:MAG TPA: FAD-dependent oxidoreductase, partial [Candidatus Omnitrophica bacterium]|nr:FAD-dependent oxidoreductase [Candidatus Omnitrophota bacterium]